MSQKLISRARAEKLGLPPDSAFANLVPRRQTFVQKYIEHDFNGAKAARESGYTTEADRTVAYDLLALTDVQRAILELAESVDTSNPEITAASVRSTLGELRRSGSERAKLRAAELLGRSVGMFDARQPQQHLHLHANMSDSERDAIAARAARRGRRSRDANEGDSGVGSD